MSTDWDHKVTALIREGRSHYIQGLEMPDAGRFATTVLITAGAGGDQRERGLNENTEVPRSSRIQVYSPHTAVDAAPGGLGDWLADIVTGTLSEPEPATRTADVSENQPVNTEGSGGNPAESNDDPFVEKPANKHPKRLALRRTYSRPTYPKPKELEQTDLAPSATPFPLSKSCVAEYSS
jgi:hypothetical protein